MENKPLYIAFLWHMHQPYYKNDLTQKYTLPWVRLHCTKDYYDMVAILDDFPQIKQTFNLVPSLLAQIEDYVKNNATDEFLDKTLIPAAQLNEQDKDFILLNFFMANWNTMVYSFERYAELLDRRGRYTSNLELPRVKRYFNTQDYLDLQVLFNLVWIDPYWRERDPKLQEIIAKGKFFTEEDKFYVIQKHRHIMSQVISKYKEMQDKEQIEITTTPFYHPILPLICNTDSARIATPEIILPQKPFQHPEDARYQVKKAVEYYQRCFGVKPRGMWPSEGSVSEDIIPIIADEGIKWIATDEDILANTLKIVFHKNFSLTDIYTDTLYKAYRVKQQNKELDIIFRDKTISDLIGFSYSHMSNQDAVNNFMNTLHFIRENVNKISGPHLLSIILDGENAWEFYPNDGTTFLKSIYRELSNNQCFKLVTISEYLSKFPSHNTLTNLYAGSWINHNFGVWIGHHEDNTAWEYLEKTRDTLIKYAEKNNSENIKIIEQAWEEIYIAEGSDWNWWYGDEHSSANDEEFDLLFRQHLMNVYKLIGEKIPDWLYVAIKGIAKSKPTQYPLNLIHPTVDGKMTDYYEWQNAGIYEVSKIGGTMYRANTTIKTIYYGFDLENLYLRLDFDLTLNSSETNDLFLEFVITEPIFYSIKLNLAATQLKKLILYRTDEFSKQQQVGEVSSVAIDKFVELAIPFSNLKFKAGEQVNIVTLVKRNNFEIERWPNNGLISFNVPGEDYILDYWEV